MLLWRQEWWGNMDHKKYWQTGVSQKYDLCLNQQQNLYLTFKSWHLFVFWFLWASKQNHDVLLHNPSSSLGTGIQGMVNIQEKSAVFRPCVRGCLCLLGCHAEGLGWSCHGWWQRGGAQSPGSAGPCLRHCAQNWGQPAVHSCVCRIWIQTWVEDKLQEQDTNIPESWQRLLCVVDAAQSFSQLQFVFLQICVGASVCLHVLYWKHPSSWHPCFPSSVTWLGAGERKRPCTLQWELDFSNPKLIMGLMRNAVQV